MTGVPAMSPVVFGILGGLAWFVLGLLLGHYGWT
ncbi:MAG: hypothetical protein JWN77_2216 [Frankiales bacterium]|nr:hypothetical protein [Frankiales bacterium]